MEYEKEGHIDKVDLDHGAYMDNVNIKEVGIVRKDEENINVGSNKSTSAQKGKWKRVDPPPKQQETMEIEVELQHQKRKFDTIEGSDGEKKQRLYIETIALSKLMAQHLGSANLPSSLTRSNEYFMLELLRA